MTLPRVIWAQSPFYNMRDARYPIRGWVAHRVVGWLNGALGAFGVRPGTSRKASTHFVIGHQPDLGAAPCPECGPITGAKGPLVIYQCVDLSDMAWGNGDVREPSWSRIIPGVNPNLYTVSVEHEDGGTAGGGIVTDHVFEASIALTRLVTSGDAAAIRAAGIRVRYDETVSQIAAIPKDASGFIDHNQIAGPNKPYCWRRWLRDPGFVEGSPSRRDRLLAALTKEADMPTPPLYYVPQLWRAKAGGADLREQADPAAPVVATVPASGVMFSVGEDQEAGPRWRLVVAGDPERLLYAMRSEIDPMEPTPRDAELYAGIAAVVNARVAGQPAPSADCSEQEQRVAQLSTDNAALQARISAAKAALG